jgi:hypothetical protein
MFLTRIRTKFLFDNMKIFFYNEGVDLAQIDTSQEGKVSW